MYNLYVSEPLIVNYYQHEFYPRPTIHDPRPTTHDH